MKVKVPTPKPGIVSADKMTGWLSPDEAKALRGALQDCVEALEKARRFIDGDVDGSVAAEPVEMALTKAIALLTQTPESPTKPTQ